MSKAVELIQLATNEELTLGSGPVIEVEIDVESVWFEYIAYEKITVRALVVFSV